MEISAVSDRKADMEEEANLFARCLLMPEHMLRAEIKRLVAAGEVGDLIDDANPCIPRLAKRFGVSTVVMTMRLMELELVKP
jgi:Zn-dependent peptidase ImmA (M78 family)